jgi:ring-1,2-phenylacetyl-CoA epoxidase subunit PaaC
MEKKAVKELIFKLADDLLIIGHRNSEWIGLAPLLEEDISYASIAQDKVGQSRVLYNLLNQLGEVDADTLAFMRHANKFHNCTLVELPCLEYEQTLVRHFLFDEAQTVYFNALKSSTQPDLAAFATKFMGEIKYHTLHARSILKRLLHGSQEAHDKIQGAIAELWPYCGGIFEPSPYETEQNTAGVILPSSELKARWIAAVTAYLEPLGVHVDASLLAHEGGRKGHHTEHLEPLLTEMSEVFKLDPAAEW